MVFYCLKFAGLVLGERRLPSKQRKVGSIPTTRSILGSAPGNTSPEDIGRPGQENGCETTEPKELASEKTR